MAAERELRQSAAQRDERCALALRVHKLEDLRFSDEPAAHNLVTIIGDSAACSECADAHRCSHLRDHFQSTTNSKRRVSTFLFWKNKLGIRFPISDDMLLRTVWSRLASCEMGIKEGNGQRKVPRGAVCVNPYHYYPLDYLKIMEPLVAALVTLEYASDPIVAQILQHLGWNGASFVPPASTDKDFAKNGFEVLTARVRQLTDGAGGEAAIKPDVPVMVAAPPVVDPWANLLVMQQMITSVQSKTLSPADLAEIEQIEALLRSSDDLSAYAMPGMPGAMIEPTLLGAEDMWLPYLSASVGMQPGAPTFTGLHFPVMDAYTEVDLTLAMLSGVPQQPAGTCTLSLPPMDVPVFSEPGQASAAKGAALFDVFCKACGKWTTSPTRPTVCAASATHGAPFVTEAKLHRKLLLDGAFRKGDVVALYEAAAAKEAHLRLYTAPASATADRPIMVGVVAQDMAATDARRPETPALCMLGSAAVRVVGPVRVGQLIYACGATPGTATATKPAGGDAYVLGEVVRMDAGMEDAAGDSTHVVECMLAPSQVGEGKQPKRALLLYARQRLALARAISDAKISTLHTRVE